MQQVNKHASRRIVALTVVTLFAVSGFIALNPGAASNNDYTFDLNDFEKRGPTGDWVVSGGGSSVTQTAAGERASFFTTDSDSHLGGPEYRDVIYTVEIDAPATNNNIFGVAFGLTLPTGDGPSVAAYILDWKGASQTAFGHTAPEGFTLYRIDGEVADTDAETFACYWGKDPAACDSATGGDATLEVIGSHTGLGTGWDNGASYHLGIRHEEGNLFVFVQGGAYGTGQAVIDVTGEFPEVGEFALYDFRQEDVTFNNAGFRDELPPVVDIQRQCDDGNLVENPSWAPNIEAACGGSEDTLLRLRSSADDFGAGLDGIECRLDGVVVGEDEQGCLVWQARQDSANYPYRALADDVLGNAADEIQRFQLDKIPLDLTIDFACSGVLYEDPDGAFKACDSSITVEGLSEVVFGAPEDERNCSVSDPAADSCALQTLNVHGAYDFDINATDLLGNFADRSDTFRVELEDPELPVPECDIPTQPGHHPPGSEAGWCRSSIRLPEPSALSGIQEETCELRDETDPNAVFEEVDCWEDEELGLRTQLPDGLWSYRATVESHVGRVSQIGFDTENPIEFKLDSQDPEGLLVEPEAGMSYIDGVAVPCSVDAVLVTVNTQCVARGVIPVNVEAEDPLKDDIASGLDRIEIWDGVKGVSGDSGGLWHIDTIEATGDADGAYSYDWDTAQAPAPSEPHLLQTRTLQLRLFDTAGNFERLEFEIFVLP